MKKFIIISMILALIIAIAACNNSVATSTKDDANNLKQYESLSSLPTYGGNGEITVPWEEKTSGFWVKGATFEDMAEYGDLLVKNGWTPNKEVTDYDPECILYYTSNDSDATLQLKFVSEKYIRLALGKNAVVEGLP